MEFMDTIQNFSIANINMQCMMRNKENSSNCYGYHLDGHLHNSEAPYVPTANILFHKLSKSNNKSEISFMFDSNIKKKYENFTKYISNKEHSLVKDTMDHWNQMSTGYSELFASPKGYSYVSNSVASYIIGGFVGSKSQMNNEKHKLSYDLGQVIFKILNDYKYDKSFDKVKDEKKFELNRMGRKSKSCYRDQSELFEHEYNMAIWNSLVDKSHNTAKKLNNMCEKAMEVKGENINNSSRAAVKTSLSVKPVLKMNSGEEDGLRNPVQINDEKSVITCLKISLDGNCTEKPQSIYSISENLNLAVPLMPETEDTLDSDKHKVDFNLPNIPSFSETCYQLQFRKREYSECSAESTDSESFIVFEDKCCSSSYEELTNLNFQESEYDESDCYCEEEDDCGNEEDFESHCWSKTGDECDIAFEDKEVKEANRRWSNLYKDVVVNDVDECIRKVRFNEKIKIHRIIAWDYAYRAARHGPWEQMARDRDRFKERIHRLSFIISPILQDRHRKSIYNESHI